MSVDAWVTLAVVAGVLALLVRGRIAPSLVLLGGAVAVLVLGVVTPEEAFSGFSNPAPVTVAALFVLAAAVEKTGALTPVMQRTLGDGGTYRRPLLRSLPPTMAASAFLNNTPVVAMLVMQVSAWAERRDIAPSKFLMPISFAAIMGGLLTVIGTSTTLVVSSQMTTFGLDQLGFFEISRIGLPIALVGLVLLVVMAPIALPDRRSARAEVEEEGRRFSFEMQVVPGGPLDGRSVERARLRRLEGLFLASVDRGDTVIAPVRPETVLRGGNRLHFVGPAHRVVDLQDTPGLRSTELEHVLDLEEPAVRYFEAVVGQRSPLVGKTLKDVGFRSTYQAAVLAIHRSGQLVANRLGTERIRLGDTLIIVSDPGFRDRWRDRPDFLLVAELDGSPPVATSRAWIPVALLAAVVVLAATGLVPILNGALVAAAVLLASKVLTVSEARRAIDFDVILVIASAFGLAAAMESSGLAEAIAGGLVQVAGTLGPYGVLLGLVLATIVLTELITNNAAALLMLPIALNAAAAGGVDPRGAAIAVAVAASASFLSPIGYQTNMMVYGPGGYRFTDYARLGWMLTTLVILATVILVPVFWPPAG
ncbi:di/tricarboxylate transporter [Isoptericola sp. CG 20/1183]|uniref:Di/tricarboxylate transporter n=1 Tax=Isoptericola halotolerans TaxID=300560 RepID=A0ABX5EHN4_9MICO|nr:MULTISPECIES: SLC13 family permease [Isoptericola]MCK0116842.1 SLC13 family permease [Isoptericola sp. S6320L]PRZ07783.1 di/tricarboxylate transporter [Isoptericola halotolerans]PRZ07858.1 di/tricarboxylate transporter [Isoptericola sp. CG 20/1183]